MNDLRYNYFALVLAVYCQCPAEVAFNRLENPSYKRVSLEPDEVKAMIELKGQGKTYREIGELYGITADAAYNRIRRGA